MAVSAALNRSDIGRSALHGSGRRESEGCYWLCREKVKTHVEVTPEDESGSFSIVHVKTRDRPGLLTDIVKTLKDLNVNVISAEVCFAKLPPLHQCPDCCAKLTFTLLCCNEVHEKGQLVSLLCCDYAFQYSVCNRSVSSMA